MIVARVRRPHGTRGELLIQPTTDAPEAVFAAGRRVFDGGTAGDLELDPSTGEPRALTVTASRPFKDGWLITLDTVGDRDTADRWRNRHFLAPFSELIPPEPGEAYVHELAGMRLVDESGTPRGTVRSHYEVPQGIILEVDGPDGEFDLPFNEAFVTEVDRAARVMTVSLPEGLPVSPPSTLDSGRSTLDSE